MVFSFQMVDKMASILYFIVFIKERDVVHIDLQQAINALQGMDRYRKEVIQNDIKVQYLYKKILLNLLPNLIFQLTLI